MEWTDQELDLLETIKDKLDQVKDDEGILKLLKETDHLIDQGKFGSLKSPVGSRDKILLFTHICIYGYTKIKLLLGKVNGSLVLGEDNNLRLFLVWYTGTPAGPTEMISYLRGRAKDLNFENEMIKILNSCTIEDLRR